MFFSLLAASVDGFICGFILSGLGIKINFKDSMISLGIIFMCCVTAAITGNYMAHTDLQQYLNIISIFMLLWLAMASFRAENVSEYTNIYTASLSVAMDASVACLYLSIQGYNIITVSILCALMHSNLMIIANIVAHKLIRPEYFKYLRFSAGIFFIVSAVMKLNGI
jgi:hypothetical protein